MSLNSNTIFYDVMFGKIDIKVSMNLLERKTLTKVRTKLQELENGGKDVPILPSLLIQLLNTLKDPYSNIHDFVTIIENEPIFALSVIKEVNTVKYRKGAEEVSSLKRAISLLGSTGVTKVASELLLADVIPCNSTYYKMFGQQIWLHSKHCATLSELLANTQGIDEFDAFFLGLIHDLGKVVIFNSLCEAFDHVLIACLPGNQVFKELISELSIEISYLIAKHSGLPKIYIDALQEQRLPQEQQKSMLGKTLFKSDKLSDIYLLFSEGKVTQDDIQQKLEELNVDESIWNDFLAS